MLGLILCWVMGTVRGGCLLSELTQIIGECDLAGNRLAVYYWTNCTQSPPPPLTIPCDMECPPGSYITTDAMSRDQKCGVCPRNTFSLGGGVAFYEGMWKNVFSMFNPRCENVSRKGQEQCPVWNVSQTGMHLETGAGNNGEMYRAELIGNFHILKPGVFTIRYRAFNSVQNGTVTGVTRILVNDATVWKDANLTSSFRTTEIPVAADDIEIRIIHEFLYLELLPSRLQIERIIVPGISFAAETCLTCLPGEYSLPGQSQCGGCQANFYLDEETQICVECPSDMYAVEGNSGVSSCVPRIPCTSTDYQEVSSLCVSGVTNKTYRWTEPIICDTMNSQLPTAEFGLPCTECHLGNYRIRDQSGNDVSECMPCPIGSFANKFTANQCRECRAGSYAIGVCNYTVWSPFPSLFQNQCTDTRGERCRHSSGWSPSQSVLTSGPIAQQGTSLTLSRFVNIINPDAYVEFGVSFPNLNSSNSYLAFEVDNIPLRRYQSFDSDLLTIRWNLAQGFRKIGWTYHVNDRFSGTVYIHYIAIVGSDEGGASVCSPCPNGFISMGKTALCDACPAGSTSSRDHSTCIKCDKDTYNGDIGSECKHCIRNTVPNAEGTGCVGTPVLTFNSSRSVYIRDLSRSDGHLGICRFAQVNQFCTQTFFGPILGTVADYYISVLNPGHLELNDAFQVDRLLFGYAYGSFRNKTLPFNYDSEVPRPACSFDDLKVLVNLGSIIESITYDSSLLISYTNGSQCTASGTRFSSLLNFTCSTQNQEGWPVVTYESECKMAIQWTTRHVCPICSPERLRNDTTNCESGHRQKIIKEPNDCVWPYEQHLVESCTEGNDDLTHWVVILGAGFLLSALVAAGTFLVCYCQTRQKVERLLSTRRALYL